MKAAFMGLIRSEKSGQSGPVHGSESRKEFRAAVISVAADSTRLRSPARFSRIQRQNLRAFGIGLPHRNQLVTHLRLILA